MPFKKGCLADDLRSVALKNAELIKRVGVTKEDLQPFLNFIQHHDVRVVHAGLDAIATVGPDARDYVFDDLQTMLLTQDLDLRKKVKEVMEVLDPDGDADDDDEDVGEFCAFGGLLCYSRRSGLGVFLIQRLHSFTLIYVFTLIYIGLMQNYGISGPN